jgi:hypothetical protein
MPQSGRSGTRLGTQAEIQNVFDIPTERRFELREVDFSATYLEVTISDSSQHPMSPAMTLKARRRK